MHSTTGRTPYVATFSVEAFDWDVELGLHEKLDGKEVVDLPTRIQILHEEIFKKSAANKTVAQQFYNKTVEERSYDPGDRVFIFDFEGLVKKGRKCVCRG